jgi:hypothetical protein
MEKKETPDLFVLLKQWGFMLESTINKYIQDSLNKEEIAVAGNTIGIVLAEILEAIHEYVEQLSSLLNFPTKDDVSRLGKLIVQSEDKIDVLEDKMYEVHNLLKEIKRTVLESHKAKTVQPLDDFDEKIKNDLSELITNPSGHLKQEIIKTIENVEVKLKNSLGKYSKDTSKNNTEMIKKELIRELMKPANEVDFHEVNNYLRKLLIEKKIKNTGGKI